MNNKISYISEFESLLRLKEFSQDNDTRTPYFCTYEKIAKALKEDYIESVNEKIMRWVEVTHVMYFENTKPVKYYFQSKMLYRDGFYEASIELSRSICEMICYDLLSEKNHPFGDINLIETPLFRVFLNFLAVPKAIKKEIFENQILLNIKELEDANFIKSSYMLDKNLNFYNFKIENGQKKSNLERLLRTLNEVGFDDIDNFRIDTHKFLHQVYDIGNIYIHAKESSNSPKDDAFTCLNMLAHILSDIYKAVELEGKTIFSGYFDFPDISNGINFAIEAALTPQDAQRIYFNLPSKKQVDRMLKTVGVWNGEWQNKKGENSFGTLTFYSESRDYINAELQHVGGTRDGEVEPLEIRLFGDYFHIIGFDKTDMQHKQGHHIFFELELFNEGLLLGVSVDYQRKVIFRKSA